MAYNVPDENGYVYKPRSAQAQVLGYAEEDALVKEDAARAEAAGVTDVRYIDYAAAHENYEGRPDTEPLAQRRARENATSFADQDQFRATIDLAGPVQNSTIVGTSVPKGDGYYFDDNADVPFQPQIHDGDKPSGSGVPAPDTTGTGNPDRDAQANAADTDDDNDNILDADDAYDFNPNAGPSTVPGAPTAPVATVASATSASVAFTAPAEDGGEPVTGYTVTASTGQTATGATSPIVVTGLATGTPVTFTVVATNANGNSAASAASNSVTPA